MKNEETASGRLASLPEVAVTLQDSSNVATEINFSVEEENRQLRERNHQLEAENAFLKERENTLTRDSIETFNVVIESLRQLQPGKETNRFFVEAKKRIESASPEDRPLLANAMSKRAATMIRESPAPAMMVEGDARFTYTTRTRNENRSLALVDHLKTTGKTVLKMPEARAVLETHEGRRLDRKVIWRALKTAQGLLRATKDTVWGVGRLILKCPLEGGGEEDCVIVPRPRRYRTSGGG